MLGGRWATCVLFTRACVRALHVLSLVYIRATTIQYKACECASVNTPFIFSSRFSELALRWTLRHGLLNIFELEVIIVPLNFNNVHWALAAIFPQRRRIMVLDSLGGDKERVFDVLKRYVKDEFNNKQPKVGRTATVAASTRYLNVSIALAPRCERETCIHIIFMRRLCMCAISRSTYALLTARHCYAYAAQEYDLRIDDWSLERHPLAVPRQTNGFDCGVFTCMFAGGLD